MTVPERRTTLRRAEVPGRTFTMSSSVLIIDGDPTFAENVQNALEAVGLTVYVRFDASLEELRTLRPRLLMLSAELPRGSGFGVCSRIRRDKTLSDTPIMMVTSEATDEALIRHAQSSEPANDYARKDITMPDLVDRIGRLLTQPPASATQDADGEMTEDVVVNTPPPLPVPVELPAPAPRSIGPVTGTAQMLELWPRDDFEAEFRQALAAQDLDAAPAAARGTPEERLNHLRQLVKKHELREKLIRELWDQAMARGQDLARRIVTVSAELNQHRDAAATFEEQLAAAERQKNDVQVEFQTFEEEIRRIFSEKDAEERSLQTDLEAALEARTEFQRMLDDAHEHSRDDERRLAILQEELESATTDKERALLAATSAHARAAALETQLAETVARLETAEHVARERGQAFENLRDQVDQTTYDAENRNREAASHHAEELARLGSAHIEEIAALKAEHEAAQRDIQSQVQASLAAQRGQWERDRTTMLQAQALREQQVAGQYQATIDGLTEHQRELEHEIDGLTETLDEAKRIINATTENARRSEALMERKLEAAQEAIRHEQQSAAELATSLTNETAELRAAATARIEELETQLTNHQTEQQDLRAELEQERMAHEALTTEHAQVLNELTNAEQKRAAFERALAEARQQAVHTQALLGERSERLSALEGLLAHLQGRLRDSEAVLESERNRRRYGQEKAQQNESQVQALAADNATQQALLDEAREIQADLEQQVENLVRERITLQQVNAEADIRAAALSDDNEQLRLSIAELESHEEQLGLRVAELESYGEQLRYQLANSDGRSTSNGSVADGPAFTHPVELVNALAERDESLGILQTKYAEAIESAQQAERAQTQAEQAKEHAEAQYQGLLGRQKVLTAQFAELEDQLNESRFAAASIRNALDALTRDLDVERVGVESERVATLLDRVERVLLMTREALPDEDDDLDVTINTSPENDALSPPVENGESSSPVPVDPASGVRTGGSASAFDEAIANPSTPTPHLSLLGPVGLATDDGDEERHATEIIQMPWSE